jgi:hypothetical protein
MDGLTLWLLINAAAALVLCLWAAHTWKFFRRLFRRH